MSFQKKKYEEYIEKAIVLMKEANADFRLGNSNKAVSALWFSIEMLLKAMLLWVKEPIPAKTGAVISKFVKIATKFGINSRIQTDLNALYIARMDADHRRIIKNILKK